MDVSGFATPVRLPVRVEVQLGEIKFETASGGRTAPRCTIGGVRRHKRSFTAWPGAGILQGLLRWKKEVEAVLPGSEPKSAGLMAGRYDDLPASVKGPSQMLGRVSPGCEGTHGVFPRCNFRCVPCYHGADANRVPTSGEHTVVEVARQMAVLAEKRGATAHAQLIGGEVSLLAPEDHARALEVMRFYGRIPMSFTHGDFSYAYLERLAVDREEGRRRFKRLDFAAHFDSYMYGRRGARAPRCERELHRHRARFVAMFERLRRRHGVKYYLAHNMTVQEGNLGEVGEVVRVLLRQRWRLVSFQPAAAQGARRAQGVDPETVWAQIEAGAGTRLPWRLWQMGHTACNRMSLCAVLSGRNVRAVPMFDDESVGDAALRDAMMRYVGNIVLPTGALYTKLLLVLLRRPWLLWHVFAWGVRFARRAGWGLIPALLLGRVRLVTFVMHVFMDAERVESAWKLMQQGHRAGSARVVEAGPLVAETVERLQACSYGMAHADTGLIVPACAQHAVYDEAENRRLVDLLGGGEK